MRTVDEHLAVVLARVRPGTPVRLPLDEVLGMVAAEDLVGLVDLPGFDNSAMDGYAVRAADVAGADPARPGSAVTLPVAGDLAAGADPARPGSAVTLPVAGDLAAGAAATQPLRSGAAVRVMTGGMIPAGADTIVKVEDTDGGTEFVRIERGAAVGTSIRRRGDDLRAGTPVLGPGTVLDARRIGLLAASGHGHVLVHPRPRVAVVSTGAELAEPGSPLEPGRIHDSNSYLLAAAVTSAGGRTAYRGTVGDDPDELLALLTVLAEEVDLVVTSGGVSMGAYDVVKQALTPLGTVQFVQVAMQPGKPQGFGVLGQREVPLFALPGNPVSSYVSFEVFVRPALRTMLGLAPAVPPPELGRLAAPMRSPQGRRQIARARTCRGPDGLQVHPVAGQGSHYLSDLAAADAFVVVPESVTALTAGDEVQVMLLDRPGGSA